MTEVRMEVAVSRVRAPVSVGAAYNVIGGQPYEGSYEVTPTTAAVTLDTRGRYMTDDLVVNPIPSNYGLITWDGITLTVS